MSDPVPPRPLVPTKEAIVDGWDARAEQWDAWTPITDAWFGPASDVLIRHLDLRPGSSVLEIACGSGGFTRRLSGAVGPQGRVIATDSGPRMVALTARNLAREGFSNLTAKVMDGESADLPASSVDAVACRQGVMFFEQPSGAFQRLRAVLRPGGRIGVTVFSTPDRNPVLAVPIGVLMRWADPAGTAPPPPPGAPGPFSLGKPGRLEALLRDSGFTDVRVEPVASPLRMPSADDLVRFYRETQSDLAGRIEERHRAAAWAEVAAETASFTAPGSAGAPGELLVGSGRRAPD